MQANLLANFKPRQSYYDIIFCRNLLIYFDKPTQEKAITVLDKLLHKEGIIFVGHAETGSLKNFSYTSAKYIKAFAFKKNTPQKKTTLHQKRILNKTKKSATKILKSTHQYDAELSSSSARTKLIPLRDKNNIKTPLLDGAVYDNNKKIKQLKIEDIFILADNGDLITAEQQCNELLKTEPNAQAYYLLGIIKESAGDSEQADKSLRKAIYLNPNHYEALIHLSSIMKKQGNTKESNALFERAGRIQKRT
jgi:chemotaxis protein methyltransferase WspC